MSRTLEGEPAGAGIRVGLVVSRFNELVTTRLLAGALECLEQHGCRPADLTVVKVPGAWEIPLAVRRMADSRRHHALVALGALIRGETPHFDVLAHEVARGLGDIGRSSGVPVIFGVLTTENVQQALERAGGSAGNKGREAALTALEMADLFQRMERDARQ